MTDTLTDKNRDKFYRYAESVIKKVNYYNVLKIRSTNVSEEKVVFLLRKKIFNLCKNRVFIR